MRLHNGREKRRAVVCGAASLTLAIALLGAVPAAFAQGDGVGEVDDPVLAASAFRLGHVAIECIDADVSDGAEAHDAGEADDSATGETAHGDALAVGEARDRTYRIVNQGEASYIRLASHTLAGELVHANGLGATEEADSSSEESLWCLADDGYWYRSVPLEAGEAIAVRVSVEIPFEERWIAALSTGEPAEVVETLDIQAVQERNKVIDLGSANPWGADADAQPDVEAALSEAERSDR